MQKQRKIIQFFIYFFWAIFRLIFASLEFSYQFELLLIYATWEKSLLALNHIVSCLNSLNYSILDLPIFFYFLFYSFQIFNNILIFLGDK